MERAPVPAEADGTKEYFWLDVTITPQPARGAFGMWEPGELVLVDAASRPQDVDSNSAGVLRDLEVFRDGAFTKDEGFKYAGPQRLKMRVGVEPGYSRLKFRYYFELFGEVRLPAIAAV